MYNASVMKLVQDLSLSYEISLSIGQSLYLDEMMGHVINTIVRKTSAHRGVVWLLDEHVIQIAAAGFSSNNLKSQLTVTYIKHKLNYIVSNNVIVIDQANSDFQLLAFTNTGKEKEVVFIAIKDIIIIQLVYSRNNILNEGIASVIQGLSQKLANAVTACINYKKLLEIERNERLRLQTVLSVSEEKLHYVSYHDRLTGVFNRTYLDQKINELKDHSNVFPVSVILCDIDGLKYINDTSGYKIGDNILILVSNILKRCISSNDVLSRFGGDEFVVLLPNSSLSEANTVCRKIQELISSYNHSDPEEPISISIGMGIAENPLQLQEALNTADINMHTSKATTLSGLTGRFIKTLLDVLSARNLDTKNHVMRVKDLCMEFGKACGLNSDKLAELSLFAMVHDIGKIGVPDYIILKPGKLTAEEKEVMEKHTEIGYNIAITFPELSKIAKYILHHHEWWNGGGYPHGLREDQIDPLCRILHIVDAYDAMTNNRPYRKSMSKEEALTEIKNCSGTQFDPHFAKIFIDMMKP